MDTIIALYPVSQQSNARWVLQNSNLDFDAALEQQRAFGSAEPETMLATVVRDRLGYVYCAYDDEQLSELRTSVGRLFDSRLCPLLLASAYERIMDERPALTGQLIDLAEAILRDITLEELAEMCAKVGASNIVRMVEEMPLEWHEDDREQRLKTLWHSVNVILETRAEDRIRDRLRVSRPNLDKRTVNGLLYRARKAGRLTELDEAEDIGALADSLNQ